MDQLIKILRLLVILLILLMCAGGVSAQRLKSWKAHARKSSLVRVVTGSAEPGKDLTQDDQVKLNLIDGTAFTVDDAGENEQGFWYKRSGVTYLMTRERASSISRHPKLAADARGTKVAVSNSSPKTLPIQPVWIHLTDGARVEADSADESSAGVWYRRGSLAIFIERNRIERIEREALENAAESDSSVKERGWTTGSNRIDSLIKQNGAKYGVDPYLIFCVMEQESHFSTSAVSPRGARGLMQLMPGTSARFGVRHPFNPAESISAGARYLKRLMDQFSGRVDLVLASYNAGEGTVIKYGHKVPPYRETRDYVRRISYRYHRTKVPAGRDSAAGVQPALGN